MSFVASPLNIVTPITLEGLVVRLEPIRRAHAEDFWDIAKNALDDIFQWTLLHETLKVFTRLHVAGSEIPAGRGSVL